jgi:CheY-like chemotaxis protein
MQIDASVLVVESELGALTIVGIMLERGGYHVVKAIDQQQCLQMLQAHTPDLLLVSGYIASSNDSKLIKEIRSDAFYADMPILLMASRGDAQYIADALMAGATDHILKPILHHDLITQIKQQLPLRNTEPFPRGNALILHGTYPPMPYLTQLCQSVGARINAPVIALPSRRDGNGRNKNLGEALRSATSLTICLTSETLHSKYIKFAYEFFAQHNKPLTAILYEEVELPDAFNTAHVFRPDELELYVDWLMRIHKPQSTLTSRPSSE